MNAFVLHMCSPLTLFQAASQNQHWPILRNPFPVEVPFKLQREMAFKMFCRNSKSGTGGENTALRMYTPRMESTDDLVQHATGFCVSV